MMKKLLPLIIFLITPLMVAPTANAGWGDRAKAAAQKAAAAKKAAAQKAEAARRAAAQRAEAARRAAAQRAEAARRAAAQRAAAARKAAAVAKAKAAAAAKARAEAARRAAAAAKAKAEAARRAAAAAKAKAEAIAKAKAEAARKAAAQAAELAAIGALLTKGIVYNNIDFNKSAVEVLRILMNKSAEDANDELFVNNSDFAGNNWPWDQDDSPSDEVETSSEYSFDPFKFNKWQIIELDENTGATCGNGEPYKFLVNRSGRSDNLLVSFEGGGGCWDHHSCDTINGGLTPAGGTGGNFGVADEKEDSKVKSGVNFSIVLTEVGSPFDTKELNKYTKVYLPYCTQDLHIGDRDPEESNIYTLVDGDEIHEIPAHHNGLTIQKNVLAWLKQNLQQPKELLVTGQSAGGFASELLYHLYRKALAPDMGYLLNDAGPIMLAQQSKMSPTLTLNRVMRGEDGAAPSQYAHANVTNSWNGHTYLDWLEDESENDANFSKHNMGTVSEFLSKKWKNDRFMLVTAQSDAIITGFSYNPYYGAINENDGDDQFEERERYRTELRQYDIKRKIEQLDGLDNFGYFMPGYRHVMGGHVLSIPFLHTSTAIETGSSTKNIVDAINNVMNKNEDLFELVEDYDWDLSNSDSLAPLASCGEVAFEYSGYNDVFSDTFVYDSEYSAEASGSLGHSLNQGLLAGGLNYEMCKPFMRLIGGVLEAYQNHQNRGASRGL